MDLTRRDWMMMCVGTFNGIGACCIMDGLRNGLDWGNIVAGIILFSLSFGVYCWADSLALKAR